MSYDIDQTDDEPPVGPYAMKLTDVIAWFQLRLQEIPEEYRPTAECEMTGEIGPSGLPSIKIFYYRPETGEKTFGCLSE